MNAAPPAGSPASSGSNKTLVIIGVIVLVIAVALGGYFLGKSKGEDDAKADYEPGKAAYNEIYQRGQQAGQATGEQQGQASGEQEGKKRGLQKGKQQGIEQGDVQGANSVFAGYSSWQVGDFYIVQIGEGQNGVDYALENRTEMQPDEKYRLCSSDPNQICVISGSTGGSN